jgi:hypothetical protein
MYATAKNAVRRTKMPIAHWAIALAAIAPWSLSSAATITVNTNSAAPVAGQCALVDAIEAANFNSAVNGCAAGTAGADTIVFSSSVTTISVMLPQLGTNDAFRVIEPLTIDGGGGGFTSAESGLGNMVRIERNTAATAAFRLFSLRSPATLRNIEIARGAITVPLAATFDPFTEGGGCVASNAALTLNNVVMADCTYNTSQQGIKAAWGGALFSSSNVTGTGVIFTRNVAGGARGAGGAVYVSVTALTANATFDDAVFTANSVVAGSAFGGGIFADNLVLSNATLSGNSVRGDGFTSGNTTISARALGGGGYAENFTISDSLIEANEALSTAFVYGGGVIGSINTPGNNSLSRSVVRSNAARPSSGASTHAQGGGIAVTNFAARLTIRDSTISNNSSTGGSTSGVAIGGGVMFTGQLVMSNSTVDGNQAGGSNSYGGGLYSYGRTGLAPTSPPDNLQLFNSTISNNTSAIGGGILICSGYGQSFSPSDIPALCATTPAATVRMESNIIYANSADVYAYQVTNITGGSNITGSTTLAAPAGQQCNPNLGALADNSGPLVGSARKVGLPKATLQTRAIPEGSCAINQGNNPLGLPYDQRGSGFVRQIGSAVDVGAYEAKLRPTVTLNSVIVGTPPDAGLFNLSVTGGNPAGGTNPANNVGNGGTTGAVSVDEATDITITESAGTGTVAANYYNTFVCSNFQGPAVGTLWSFLIPASNGNAAENVTCTFSNRVKVIVSVGLTGTGSGGVGSNLRGVNTNQLIDCGATCRETFGAGIPITLTATPLAGSYFVGWSGGGCTGTGDCVVTPLAATTVTAQFNVLPRLTVTRNGAGTGSVRSDVAGIDCGASCAASFTVGTTVTLTATPQAGSIFVGWSGGACTGTGACTVQMNAAQNVAAVFEPVAVPTLGTLGRVGLPLLLAIAAFAFSNARRRA